MAEEILGVDFEVHGGGSDLVFPHHENEIAQTEAARGKPLARVWMHNGMVEMGAEKMAKSVGNIRLLHGALDEFGPEALLMCFVGGHYRKPIAFSEDALARRRPACDVRELVRRLDPEAPEPEGLTRSSSASSTRSRTTSTPPPRGPRCSTGWPRPTAASTPASDSASGAFARCCRRSGWSGSLATRREAPEEAEAAGRAREEARAERDFEAPTTCGTSSPRAGGRCATPPRAPGSCAAGDRLRPQPGPGGAPRARAGGAGLGH